MTLSPRIVFLSWSLFYLAMLAGARIRFVLPVLVLSTLIYVGVHLKRGTLRWNQKYVAVLSLSILGVLALSRVAFKFFRFESGQSQYWDFGQFLQATYNLSTSGTPWITYEGRPMDYFTIHRSISAHILAWLYGWISHPIVLWGWQTFWLIAPAGILWLVARHATREIASPQREVIRTLSPLLWVVSPVFSGQFQWAYDFHIAGVSLLLLSAYFFEKKRLGLWVLCLVVASLEKEEFGLYAASFGFLSLGETLILKKKYSVDVLAALGVIGVGVLSFVLFAAAPSDLNRASLYYPNWGTSFSDIIIGSASHPGKTLELWLQPRVLKIVLFSVLVSGIWVAPSWKGIRYVLISIPVILAYGLGTYEPLTNIRNHYSLPILGFSAIGLLVGTLQARRDFFGRNAYFRFASCLFLMTCFGFHNPFRGLKPLVSEYIARAPELDKVDWLVADKSLVVCCESTLCSHFAERSVVIEVSQCLNDQNGLKEYRGKQLVWVFPRNRPALKAAILDRGAELSLYSFFTISKPTRIE